MYKLSTRLGRRNFWYTFNMFYAVIHRPEIDTNIIDVFSAKYDPSFGLVGPHVTLLFPLNAEDIDLSVLEEHIQGVVRMTRPFDVRLDEIEISWDQWLFLTPSVGRSEFSRLHNDLYSGLFQKFLRKDIDFVPHVALGHFAISGSEYSLKDPTAVPLDEEKYEKAREEIASKKLNYEYRASSLELISVNDEFTKSETLSEFKLKF
jgi:2'-5' RNA ligase